MSFTILMVKKHVSFLEWKLQEGRATVNFTWLRFSWSLKKLLFLLFITFKYGITDVTVSALSQFSKYYEMPFITGVTEITRDENPPKNVCEKQIYYI